MKPNAQIQYVSQDGRLTMAGMQLLDAQARQIAALEAKLAALGLVTTPAGGGTQDAEARAAINAIINAAG